MNDIYEDITRAMLFNFGRTPEKMEHIKGGANNICVKVETGSSLLLAKKYFVHRLDKRDRLNAEYSMLSFLWRNNVRCIPEPLAMDNRTKIGFYSFIQGARPDKASIGIADVEHLGGLLGEMWRLKDAPGAGSLPAGSDAAFRVQDYIDCVAARLDAILRRPVAREAEIQELKQFADNRLLPVFQELTRQTASKIARFGVDPATALPVDKRTLNPADHGFHNAIRQPDGSLIFIDFEYAGWDDPAQMICNACLQPQTPIPACFVRCFLDKVLDRIEGDSELIIRLKIAYPLLAFKWCLIMLNEFLPVSSDRRRFAGSDSDARRADQLGKAVEQLKKVEVCLAGKDDLFGDLS